MGRDVLRRNQVSAAEGNDRSAAQGEFPSDDFHLGAGSGPLSPIYKDMERHGYLYSPVGWAGFRYFDAYNPAANDLYWKYANKGLFSKGVDAWWMDSTEPDIVNALTKESEEYEMKRVENNHLGSFARYLNPYSLVDHRGVYKNQRKETDRKRVYILTRSTFAGQQRAAATTWSGDIGANWDVFRKQIPGGDQSQHGGHSLLDVRYRRILARVARVACSRTAARILRIRNCTRGCSSSEPSAPIFRSHGSETPREIWEFGEYSDTLVKFDNLRYRLMPYIYSLGWRVTHDGYSIMRGLPMDFAQRPQDVFDRRPVHVRPGDHGFAGDRVYVPSPAGRQHPHHARALPDERREAGPDRQILLRRRVQEAVSRSRGAG